MNTMERSGLPNEPYSFVGGVLLVGSSRELKNAAGPAFLEGGGSP